MTDKVKEQILELREYPNCPNMFDVKVVFELALAMNFYELADFMFMDTQSYITFILYGDRGE